MPGLASLRNARSVSSNAKDAAATQNGPGGGTREGSDSATHRHHRRSITGRRRRRDRQKDHVRRRIDPLSGPFDRKTARAVPALGVMPVRRRVPMRGSTIGVVMRTTIVRLRRCMCRMRMRVGTRAERCRTGEKSDQHEHTHAPRTLLGEVLHDRLRCPACGHPPAGASTRASARFQGGNEPERARS